MERITQIYSGFGWHLMPELMEKYNLVRVRDHSRPCLFFGCYGDSQIEKAIKYAQKAKVVIWWSGSDVLHMIKNPDYVEQIKSPSIKHVATVNFIEKDLAGVGITYDKVPLFSLKTALFEPYPLGDAIYVYKPGSGVYCPMPLYNRIRKEFSGIRFIEAHNHHTFTQTDLREVYKQSFLALRFTRHDGLAHTAAEIGLMGRKIVWNGNTPNALNYSDEDGIMEQIESTIKQRYCPYIVAKRMHEYMDDPSDKWLYV